MGIASWVDEQNEWNQCVNRIAAVSPVKGGKVILPVSSRFKSSQGAKSS